MQILVILIGSSPILAKKSVAYLEKDYPYRPVSEVEAVDTVVVLSGMIHTFNDDQNQTHYELDGAIDRFEAGIDFIEQQKAQKVIFTRGYQPWSIGKPEGEILKAFAIERGIPEEKIVLTEKVQNTDQEARAVKRLLLEDEKVALITSAFHMQRARRVFKVQGIDVTPHAVDFIGEVSKFTPMDLLPNVRALAENSLFVREMIGRLYYAIRY
ncbi:MAG: YdcF family protein [Roseibium sp.]